MADFNVSGLLAPRTLTASRSDQAERPAPAVANPVTAADSVTGWLKGAKYSGSTGITNDKNFFGKAQRKSDTNPNDSRVSDDDGMTGGARGSVEVSHGSTQVVLQAEVNAVTAHGAMQQQGKPAGKFNDRVDLATAALSVNRKMAIDEGTTGFVGLTGGVFVAGNLGGLKEQLREHGYGPDGSEISEGSGGRYRNIDRLQTHYVIGKPVYRPLVSVDVGVTKELYEGHGVNLSANAQAGAQAILGSSSIQTATAKIGIDARVPFVEAGVAATYRADRASKPFDFMSASAKGRAGFEAHVTLNPNGPVQVTGFVSQDTGPSKDRVFGIAARVQWGGDGSDRSNGPWLKGSK